MSDVLHTLMHALQFSDALWSTCPDVADVVPCAALPGEAPPREPPEALIDLPELVHGLRQQRMGMVQVTAWYMALLHFPGFFSTPVLAFVRLQFLSAAWHTQMVAITWYLAAVTLLCALA